MDSLFRIDEMLPVDPGASPFHVRGMYYQRILQHAKELPGGTAQFLGELRDARVRQFMEQRFTFMDWYDALPTLPAQVALWRIRGGEFEAFIQERSRLYMEKLIPSMFRVLSTLGGPQVAAAHSNRILQTYFDFLDHRIDRISESAGSGILSGIPLYSAPVTVNTILGTITGALQSLGAKDVRARYYDVAMKGRVRGFETMTCRADFEWRLDGGRR